MLVCTKLNINSFAISLIFNKFYSTANFWERFLFFIPKNQFFKFEFDACELLNLRKRNFEIILHSIIFVLLINNNNQYVCQTNQTML